MTTHAPHLIARIEAREASIAVIGLGHVGLPLALAFAEHGFRVGGVDIDHLAVERLNGGRSHLAHIPDERVAAAVASGRFSVTADQSWAREADAIVICLPTPLNAFHEPDLSELEHTLDALVPYLKAGQLFSLESTVYPGATEDLLVRRCRSHGLTPGEDVFIVYSPEREDPGNTHFGLANTPKVVSGATPSCLRVGLALYGQVAPQLAPVSSPDVAEFSKLLENSYRAVNISFVNEMKMIADRLGIDIWEAIDAAATKPFGFSRFTPGPGIGGHCIPVDPYYLAWKARQAGIEASFIELAGALNREMPRWVARKVATALEARGVAIEHSRVLILGVAYKKNVGDVRESQAVPLIDALLEHGATVVWTDPIVAATNPQAAATLSTRFPQIAFDATDLTGWDCVVLVTDHDAFDADRILRESRLIVDTRGRYRGGHPHVVSA